MDDYRKSIQAKGTDTSGMRPMGSAESQMRIFAKRTKSGGYSWSDQGVRAMLRTMMRIQEDGRVVRTFVGQASKQATSQQPINMRQLLKNVTQLVKGCIAGMIRILQGPKQSSTTGMALKGLQWQACKFR